MDRYFLVELEAGRDVGAVMTALRAVPGALESVEHEWIGGLLRVPPSDEFFPLQWGLHNTGQVVENRAGRPGSDIAALAAWANANEQSDATLAIIDTGVSRSHPDLAGRLLAGRNFSGIGAVTDSDDSWYVSHGTACAAIAAASADDGFGVAGVCWRANILPVKVTNAFGSGTESQLASGIVWATDQHADVLSISLGYPGGSNILRDAVLYAMDKGSLICASSGNTPTHPIGFPARFESVLAVGATDNRDQSATFMSTGPELDVVAPGISIYTAWDTTEFPNSFEFQTGTSMAAPYVAGVACLLKSVEPTLGLAGLMAALIGGAQDLGEPGWDAQFGHGRVNASAALAIALGWPDCPADWNHDGQLTLEDLFSFLNDYFSGNADFNGSGTTSQEDLLLFLAAFYAGC